MTERHEIWKLLDQLQMNNRADAAKLVDLRARVASLDLPNPAQHRCPHCGITRPGANPLAEHVHHSHGGPVPAHWLAIEARSLPVETPDAL